MRLTKLKPFVVWRDEQKEMAGVATIVNPSKDCHNPDFQVQGAVCGKVKTKPAIGKKL
jgi:hypothetical protein